MVKFGKKLLFLNKASSKVSIFGAIAEVLRITAIKAVQPPKALGPIVSTLAGISILLKLVQASKAFLSISLKVDGKTVQFLTTDSPLTKICDKVVALWKANSPILSNFFGSVTSLTLCLDSAFQLLWNAFAGISVSQAKLKSYSFSISEIGPKV
jgi:hypothetical protein